MPSGAEPIPPSWFDLVHATVRLVPGGRVATYGQIAALLSRPRGAREVGWAMHGCVDARVPCHRVVDRTGRLAPHFREQRARLERDGVPFTGDRVVVTDALWVPTSRELRVIGRSVDAR